MVRIGGIATIIGIIAMLLLLRGRNLSGRKLKVVNLKTGGAA